MKNSWRAWLAGAEGEVALSLVAAEPAGARFWCNGLYPALFGESRP